MAFYFCSISFKPYLNAAATYRTLQRGGIGYSSNLGVVICCRDSLVEHYHAVVTIEEDVADVDGHGAGSVGGKCGIKVFVFLVAVEFSHVQCHRQKSIEGLCGGVVGQFGSEIGSANGEFEGRVLDAQSCQPGFKLVIGVAVEA